MSSVGSRGVLGAAIVFTALWAGCVGDDPAAAGSGDGADGAAVGELRGKCFADGKCKEGLVCVQGAICLNPGETIDGGPSGTDGGPTADGGGNRDADVDGRTSEEGLSCQTLTSTANGFDCPLSNGTTVRCDAGGAYPSCCPGVGCAPPVGGCTDNKYACMSELNCPAANPLCCLSGKVEDASSCSLTKQVNPTSTSATALCTQQCGTDAVTLCSSQQTCPPGMSCRSVTIFFGTIPFVVHACAP